MDAPVSQGRESSDTTPRAGVVYDELRSAVRAKDGLECAALNAQLKLPWDVKFWRFDSLEAPTDADAALIEASPAELMLVVMHDSQPFPDHVLFWLERWAKTRAVEDSALSVLVWGGAEAAGASIAQQLRVFAARHRLMFVSAETGPGEVETPVAQSLHARAFSMTPTLQEILDHTSSYRHFGLNE
jgi:hypothetical protein